MRPDNLILAMRHDLVCILKDVVDLIARIEASIPNSPEESRERTSRTTGECPEASPADETPPVAGAGAAGPQGTVATITDRPTDAAPPSVVPAEPPAAPKPPQPQPAPQEALLADDRPTVFGPMAEQVLELWSTTSLSQEQIALRVGCGRDSVRAFVSQGRAAGDRRGFARKPIKADPPAATAPAAYAVKPQSPASPHSKEEREPPVSGFAKPVTQAPFTPADLAPLMGIGQRPDAKITEASVVGIDPVGCIIRGPLADWTTDAPTMRTIRKMNVPGGLFDKKTLLEAGRWPGIETFERRLPLMKRHLAAIGVDLVDLKGAGCRIRVAGT